MRKIGYYNIDTRNHRPNNRRNGKKFKELVPPKAGKDRGDNRAYRQSINIKMPARKRGNAYAENKKQHGRDKPDYTDRQGGYNNLITVKNRSFDFLFAYHIVHRDPEKVGNTFYNIKVGQTLAALPFRNRFIRIVELFGKLKLSKPKIPAVACKIMRKIFSDFFLHIKI